MSGAAFIETSSQRYSPIQENAAMKPTSRPSSRASDGKGQDGNEELPTPFSKADSKQSPYSQGQNLSLQTTTDSSSYSLQFYLDMGFSLTDATRIYHARVSKQSEKDKQAATDREISLSPLNLQSVSGLSSPSKQQQQQQPTTPLHVRVSILLGVLWIATFISSVFCLCKPSGRCYRMPPSSPRRTLLILLSAATQRKTTASWDRFPSPAR